MEELTHHGIKGMRWGIRRTREQLGHLTRKDARWAKRNQDKITSKAYKKSANELSAYGRQLMSMEGARNSSGKISAATVNAYNRKMASLMNEQVKDITSPSGKIVQFVAKRGEVGVHMALSDAGYDISQLKNGVYSSGKIAYRKKNVDVAHV